MSRGIVTPKNNNAAITRIDNVAVSGYWIGIEMNEHAHVTLANVTGCWNALWYLFGNHRSWFDGTLQFNKQNIVIAGACMFQARINIEHAVSGWQVTDYDVKDVGNLCVGGEVAWSIVTAGIGQDDDFVQTGGENITCRRVGAVDGYNMFYGTTALTVTTGTDTALTFPTTYISDGMTASGSTITVTKAGAYEFEAVATYVTNATGARMLAIIKNGSTIVARDSKMALPTTDTTSLTARNAFHNLDVGDTLQVLTKQTSGGDLDLTRDANYSGSFKARRLSKAI